MTSLDDIRVESTNYCGYHCTMCPHDTMKRPKGFQSIDDLQWILKNISGYQSGFHGRFQLHSYGESLLDKALPEKISLVRRTFPQSYIFFLSTVGYEMAEGFFENMVQMGLNHLGISCYGIDRQSYLKIHRADRFELVMKNMAILSSLVERYQGAFAVTVSGPFIGDRPQEHQDWMVDDDGGGNSKNACLIMVSTIMIRHYTTLGILCSIRLSGGLSRVVFIKVRCPVF
jgi:hypothetical protein